MLRFQARVFDLSQDGLGVVKSPEGVIFFVAGVWPGDEGEFEVTVRKKKNYGYAKVVVLTTLSSERTDPPCPYHGFSDEHCGGCPWQFIDYKSQLTWKEMLLNQAVKRSGFLKFQSKVESIIPSSHALGYRNRVSMKTDGEDIGFLAYHSHSLVPVEDCIVLNQKNRDTLKNLIRTLPRQEWQPSSERAWRSIEFDDQMIASEVQVDAPLEFRQANDFQNQAMKNWIANEFQELNLSSKILELFCGNGNFTEVFKNLGFCDVIGVELSREAVESAARKFEQFSFFSLNLYERSEWKKILKSIKDVDVLFLDPPREGFPQLPDLVNELDSIQVIYYVSCNHSTFFRDLSPMMFKDWSLLRLQPFDLFPQTPHLEIIGKFIRNT